MIAARLAIYGLYVVLGIVILTRLLHDGLHWQLFSGVIFATLLIVLGTYRIRLYLRTRGRGA